MGARSLVPMSTPIAQLRGSLDGRVTVPGDAGYDQARKVFYGKWDRRPAVIVRPADAGEVARVVTLAAESGAELAVRSGGHSLAGHSLSDGGIVLDLGELTALDLDLAARTAWAQTGLTAGAYTEAVGGHGLVTGFGDTASVGIGGLTLGGGGVPGPPVRLLTIDSLLAAELVTADGRILRVDGERYPDLFWAIRGGGATSGSPPASSSGSTSCPRSSAACCSCLAARRSSRGWWPRRSPRPRSSR